MYCNENHAPKWFVQSVSEGKYVKIDAKYTHLKLAGSDGDEAMSTLFAVQSIL